MALAIPGKLLEINTDANGVLRGQGDYVPDGTGFAPGNEDSIRGVTSSASVSPAA